MDATTQAADAVVNGTTEAAEQVANNADNVRNAAARIGAVSAETGLAFLGLSVAVVSARYSLERFATAFKAAKG